MARRSKMKRINGENKGRGRGGVGVEVVVMIGGDVIVGGPIRECFIGVKTPKDGKMKYKLAVLVHTQWSNWMKYIFSKGTFNPDGTWTMPKWAVERWTRQMTTHFDNLSRGEQNTDFAETEKFMEVVRPFFRK